MKNVDDLLIEIHTEELPPKALLKLATAFQQQIKDRLEKAGLSFENIAFYATPRRLAVIVKQLISAEVDKVIERKGPALTAAFDQNGNPSPACAGFAKSCGVTPKELITIKNSQGEWVGYMQSVAGKSVTELLGDMVEQAAMALPIPRKMRWGNNDTQFVRPVHSIILLYGNNVIDATILGCKTGRRTRGHRFHAPEWIEIDKPENYLSLLEKNHVIADFNRRRDIIEKNANAIGTKGKVLMADDLLNEVTGIVEWPVALMGQFDAAFLQVPKEVLISSMQDHQRYFPMVDQDKKLLPNFILISNIESKEMNRVVSGNEKVLRARLADAAFFYAEDRKEKLSDNLERLKNVVYQAKLGTMHDRALRISKLAQFIAKKINVNEEAAARAGLLAKADLATNMVGEFPELQGVMGRYYALHDGESAEVAQAIDQQYLPRFAGDLLPTSAIGQVVAIAEKIDTLIGTFGIKQIPTGDKDPYGLRRAALGMLRILIEKQIHLDLAEILNFAVANYTVKLENTETVPQVLNFLQERLRAWYQDQAIGADVFAAVAALNINDPLDVHERIKAVQAFKQLNEADALSVANKRVSNILSKYTETIIAKDINADIFTDNAEKELAKQLSLKSKVVAELALSRKYADILLQLAGLRVAVDDFFDKVMVMSEDKSQRENRILLLSQLRMLFLRVADIALLQSSQS